MNYVRQSETKHENFYQLGASWRTIEKKHKGWWHLNNCWVTKDIRQPAAHKPKLTDCPRESSYKMNKVVRSNVNSILKRWQRLTSIGRVWLHYTYKYKYWVSERLLFNSGWKSRAKILDPVKIVKGKETETWKTEIRCVSVCAEDLLVRKGFGKQSNHFDLKTNKSHRKQNSCLGFLL